ncbi:MAG: hypothetical protein AAF921_11650 [Cyanobacteria bacterium P01_D01_bin.44]
MKSAFLTLAALPALLSTFAAFFAALPAKANLSCYMDYPGSYTLNLESLCSGNTAIGNPSEIPAEGETAAGEPSEGGASFSEADILQLRITRPVIETTSVTGDLVQGRALSGTFYNPHGRMSNRVTLFYSVQTNQELKTGTMMAPAIAPNGRTQIEVAMPDLRGVVESYQFEILD